MNDNNNQSFLRELWQELGDLWASLTFYISISGLSIRNWFRRLRRVRLDFVVIPVGGPLPERSGPPRSFWQRQLPLPPQPTSLEVLNYQLGKVADAENVRGAILIFRGFSAGMATLTNLRQSIKRLREAGKKVVVFTPYLDLAHYYTAAAADLIIIPPSTKFEVLGVRSEVMFFKDALDQLGIQAEVIQISPYKTAYDGFARSDISPQQEEQINWIINDTFEVLVQAMASDRQIDPAALSALIDQAPLVPEDALENRLVDHLAYEDNLPFLLAEEPPPFKANQGQADDPPPEDEKQEKKEENKAPRATIISWERARRSMLENARRPTKKYIGVISLEGAILMGTSRKPPVEMPLPIPMLSGEVAGETTFSQMLRRVERDPQLAALIFHIDSPGGLSLASDLIWRQIARLSKKKPVLAYFGNVAASGGYYVAAQADHIMGQPTTLTGSIGVIAAHFSTAELYKKLKIKRVFIGRGEHVPLLSDSAPLTDDQLKVIWSSVIHTYDQFKKAVSIGRKLPYEELDEIANGKVWTGNQALGHKLIDSHGDFIDAVKKAMELAELKVDDKHEIPVLNIYPVGEGYLPPKPLESVEELLQLLSTERLAELQDRTLTIMPFQIRIR